LITIVKKKKTFILQKKINGDKQFLIFVDKTISILQNKPHF
jgi:hypothetical protein